MKEIIIKENDSNQTLIKFMNKYLSKAPNSLIYKWIRKKKIKVNKKKAEPSLTLQSGDLINIYIYDEELENWKEEKKEFRSLIDVEIAFENDDIMIMDKQQNVLVHAANPSDYGKNLVDFMVDLMISRGEYNPRIESTFRPSLVNRIDRNTMGLVIGGKNREAVLTLNKEQDKINKFYLAIVHGKINKKLEINNELIKDENNNVRVAKGGKKSITIINPIENRGEYSLVEIELLTGRTHQIRTTLADLGHPIVGDRRYGNHMPRIKGVKDQQLAAYKVSFDEDIELNSVAGITVESKYKNFIMNQFKKISGDKND